MRRLEPGDTIGRYRIERRLGMGAMGEVFLAEDPQIGRRLAIKTVRVEEGKPKEIEERKQRLLREARAAGKLLHPRVVTLFDVGEDGELLYLAFEFIDGTDLADRIDHGPPLTLGEALAITRQAAEGLDYAHRQGIVHRDIKPSNLMLTSAGEIKVADFGIAKMLDSTSDLTMSGSVVGSPHYLSPEQIRGEPLDGRTDVFSLGVLLYEILSRRRPFDGETLTTLVYQILNEEPTPLAARRPDLGLRVDQLVRRMMHKDRDQRYGSARDVVAAIEELEAELGPELLGRLAAPPDEVADRTHLMASTGAAPPPPPPPAGGTISTAATTVTPATAASVRPPPPPPAPIAPLPSPVAPPPSGRGRWIAFGIAGGSVLALLLVVGLNARRFAGGLLGGKEAPAAESAAGPEAPAPPTRDTAPAEGATPAAKEPEPTAARPTPDPEPPVATFSPGERESNPGPGTSGTSKPAAAAPPAPSAPAPKPPIVATPKPEPAVPVSEPEPEPTPAPEPRESAPLVEEVRDALISRLPVAREMATGMKLSIEVEPKKAAERVVVKLDRIVLGRASEWDASRRNGRAYSIPEPGLHILTFLLDGNDVYRIRIDASPERGGTTSVVVNLPQAGRRPGRN